MELIQVMNKETGKMTAILPNCFDPSAYQRLGKKVAPKPVEEPVVEEPVVEEPVVEEPTEEPVDELEALKAIGWPKMNAEERARYKELK